MELYVEVVPWLTHAFGFQGPGRMHLSVVLTPGATLADVLTRLAFEHPKFATYALAGDGVPLCPHVCVTLNGEVISTATDLGRVLGDGDLLVLLPAFAGG